MERILMKEIYNILGVYYLNEDILNYLFVFVNIIANISKEK